MKQTLYILCVFALLTGAACSSGKKNSGNNAAADSAILKGDSIAALDKTDYSQFYNKPERLDTIIGDWEIHVHLFYDGTSFIEPEGHTYATYPLRINIQKGGKTVVENRIISYKTLLEDDSDQLLLLSFGRNLFVTETTVYVDVTCCPPETDDANNYLLAFSADGKDSKYSINYELEDGETDPMPLDICTFYAMYAHELLPHTMKNNPLFATPRFSPEWVNTLVIYLPNTVDMTWKVAYRRSPGDGKKVARVLKLKALGNEKYLFDGVEEPGKAVAWEE